MNEDNLNYKTHAAMLEDESMAGRPLKDLTGEIQSLYCADDRPWIIGFSGGKDSTTILSLIYAALQLLPKKQRHKHIYVVSSDTLVETPVVVDMIQKTIKNINSQAIREGLPISAHAVVPKTDQTFWTNLLGRGYPAPTKNFRWCTERMKIDPVSNFITDKVARYGEAIVVLGSRKQESSSRAQVIAKHKIEGSSLSRHTSLPNAFTYMPIEDWSADDVWLYLLGAPCPWGGTNLELFHLYKDSNQGECPLVIDTSTPSCGNSRFGCWTCTVVTEDKAIHSLVQNGEVWLKPLLDFRNQLYISTIPENKNQYRNHKRRTGKVSFQRSEKINEEGTQDTKHIPGPYWLNQRKTWLRHLLEIEKKINDEGHEIQLIQRDELQAIRQEWLRDPNEPDWADSLPKIFSDIYPEENVEWVVNDAGAFTEPDALLLKELELKHGAPAELIMKMIEAELAVSGLGKRKGILDRLNTLLNQDWETLETITERKKIESTENYREKMQEMQKLLEAI